ncbi:DJ-1/PfpI family protein [Mycolicibacterium diernhoferi]|uniref:DJ-1/PfpI domain-containing protein n=1 Tax=Mycolicibacterium diernhoferi TaxID=1801 RepID=A0A1Q4H912_9MYCO|nr:DJ-1/PfpI family protein [Mycolicibacterium diernhoferi]OJZ64034.1 hypothetical protein BRW64_20115 [Mycolicibacterium diernhoferi]OPE53764.1 hypothetical protein BV510_13845 [Mycolicibacterium diernhoferi]QYL20722.1 DJ-1/PfpI family protein [Mycolicibacterium diernhoferi]
MIVRATRIGVDKTISGADPTDCNGHLLPGGFISPDLLRQSAEARQFVRELVDRDKPIATLCHGPWVLASSGATWLNRDVVKDGNLVTSRGPQDMTLFIPAIIDHFADTAPEAPAAATGRVSDPQLNSPVGWAVAALRWSPKPSIPGALAGLMAGACRYVSTTRDACGVASVSLSS